MIFLPGVSHQKTQISALQFMTVAKSQLQSSKKKKKTTRDAKLIPKELG